jgi:flagellar hook assembly protein FlgD
MPVVGHLTARIYDMNGREVATLSDKSYDQGHHTLNWDAQGFASGIYLVKLATPEHTEISKLTLLK